MRQRIFCKVEDYACFCKAITYQHKGDVKKLVIVLDIL
nr:MAG TPA: hypothetical protein [Bacteriophage sp.]